MALQKAELSRCPMSGFSGRGALSNELPLSFSPLTSWSGDGGKSCSRTERSTAQYSATTCNSSNKIQRSTNPHSIGLLPEFSK